MIAAPSDASANPNNYNYSGGMPTAVNVYFRPNYSQAWNVRLSHVDSAWNSVPVVTYTRTTTSAITLNSMYVANYPWPELAWYYPYTASNGTRYFMIEMNSRTIANSYNPNCGKSDCWGNYLRSVGVHELGHGLSLTHNPQAIGKPPGYYLSIMAVPRDRHTIFMPQSYDRQNVTERYS